MVSFKLQDVGSLEIKGYGASIAADENEFSVTANNSAGKDALGADRIRFC